MSTSSERNPVPLSPGDLSKLTPAEQKALLAKLLQQKVALQKQFPMSAGQQGLWHAFRRDSASTNFNVFLPTRVRSPMNPQALQQAINSIARRHPSLRTVFFERSGELLQEVKDDLLPEFRIIPIHGASDEEARRVVADETLRPFDLQTGPLIRIIVFQVADDDWIVLAMTHHIIVDFWSLILIMNELRLSYPHFATGESLELAPAVQNYRQFVEEQNQFLASEAGSRLKDYWTKTVMQGNAVLELPLDRVRPTSFTGRAANYPLDIPPSLLPRILQYATQTRSTPFSVIHSALQILLSRMSRQQSFFIGSPFVGRRHQKFEQTVGFFINMLPILAEVDPAMTFHQVVDRTKVQLLDALENEAYPISQIIHDAGVERDPSRSPLFQVSCTFEKSHVRAEQGRAGFLFPDSKESFSFAGLRQESFYIPHPTCHYDMEFVFEQNEERLRGMIVYCRDLFDEASVKETAANYADLLGELLSQPHLPIGEVAWPRRPATVAKSSGTFRSKTLTTLAAAQLNSLAKHSDALIAYDATTQTTWTPADFQTAVAKLQSSLRQLGVDSGSIVAVVLPRGPLAFAAFLAIQTLGAAPVPLDESQPSVSAELLREDAGVKVVVSAGSTSWLSADPRSQQWCVLDANECLSTNAVDSVIRPESYASNDDVAYVVYTSGSTGRPKGVIVEHKAIGNTLRWRSEDHPLRADDRILMTLSHQFDAGLVVGWTGILQNAGLIWPEPVTLRDPAALVQFMLDQRITILPTTPSLLRVLMLQSDFANCDSLRAVWCGGEAMASDLPAIFRARSRAKLWNFYGPTETAVEATACEVTNHPADRFVPIGKPIAETKVVIVDSKAKPVADTIPGEIAIAGAGLARGYLADPEKTAQRFVMIHNGATAERFYLTGDCGRRLPDGQVEYLGRLDFQVKVRGYRIELDEIDLAIERIPFIQRSATVVVNSGMTNAYLSSYVTLRDSARTGSNVHARKSVMHELSHQLPKYKLPSCITIIDEMPITSSGKVDRARVTKLPEDQSQQALRPPETEIERVIERIWSEQLVQPSIGIDIDFFAAGGSSLQAAIVTTKLTAELGVQVPTALLFDLASVRGIAKRLIDLHPEVMVHRFGVTEVERQSALTSQDVQYGETALHALLSPLKLSGNRPPLFLVHPPGGIVACYRELATHLDTDQPLVAIRSRGLHGSETLPQSLTEMATDYLDAIRSLQPNGPYHIGGWSLGGLIAYEIAQQLLARGEKVHALQLLDTTIPEHSTSLVPSHEQVSVGKEYGVNLTLKQLGELSPEEQLPFLWQHAKNLGVLVDETPEQVVQKTLNELQHLFSHHVALCSNYQLQPIGCDIRLYRPTDVPVEVPVAHDRGWSYLARTVEVHFVPGHHHSMVQEPHVSALANVLQSTL